MEKEPFYQEPSELNHDNYERSSADFIPAGTFYAGGNDELTRERIIAIQFVEEIGNQLATEHPEIVELYKDPSNRLIDIACQFFPKEYVDQFPDFYSKAVGYAIRQINPIEEQADLTRQHRQQIATINFNLGSAKFIAHCKEAAKKRHEMHGVDTEAMIRGRGREPWSLSEKASVNDLVIDPNFQHQSGSIKGTPDYKKISDELNRLFHNGQEIRTSNSVGSLVRDIRREKR